jgi:hypothetical protein
LEHNNFDFFISPRTSQNFTMPRGKNYVNNNKGVVLQASSKSKQSMKMCEYGPGCTRDDCVYRHEGNGKSEEVCLPFLAGKCTFATDGCRKRHPTKDEFARLLSKYKRTRCRFADECYTEGCLYLHPRDVGATEPNYVEPNNDAFPPLNGAIVPSVPKAPFNSAWKAAPAVAPTPQAQVSHTQAQISHVAPVWVPSAQPQMCAPYYPQTDFYDHDPTAQVDGGYYVEHEPQPVNFNANAKEFIPGNSMA